MASDTQDQPATNPPQTQKLPASYPNSPSLTSKQALACDMDRPAQYDHPVGADGFTKSRLYAGGKVLAPVAVWILVVVACLSFLSLMSSLNRTMVALDDLVKLEQERLVNGTDDSTKFDQPTSLFDEPKSSDWFAVPTWMSLEPKKAAKNAKGEIQGVQSMVDEILRGLSRQMGDQDGPISGSIVISSNVPFRGQPDQSPAFPNDLISSVVGKMFPSVDTDQQASRKPIWPINTNIDRFDVSFDDDDQQQQQQQAKLRHRHPSSGRPKPSLAELSSAGSLDQAFDSVLDKLAKQAAISHELPHLIPPVGGHHSHPAGGAQHAHHWQADGGVPNLLVPLGQKSSMEEIIPPMFGRPSMHEPVFLSFANELPLVKGLDGAKQVSPYELRPINPPEEFELEPLRASRKPEGRPQPSLEELMNGLPVQPDVSFVLEEEPATTRQPGKVEPPGNMKDLFQFFLGPPPAQANPSQRPWLLDRSAASEQQQLGKLAKSAKAQLQPDRKASRLFPMEDQMGAERLVNMLLGQAGAQSQGKPAESRLFPKVESVGLDEKMLDKILALPVVSGEGERLSSAADRAAAGRQHEEKERSGKKSRADEESVELNVERPDAKEALRLAENLFGMITSPQFSGSTPPVKVAASESPAADKDISDKQADRQIVLVTSPASQSEVQQMVVVPSTTPTKQAELGSLKEKSDIILVTPGISKPITTTQSPADTLFHVEFTSQHPLDPRASVEILEESSATKPKADIPAAAAVQRTSSAPTLAPLTFDYSTAPPASQKGSTILTWETSTGSSSTSISGRQPGAKGAATEPVSASSVTTTERPSVSVGQDSTTRSPFKSFFERADNFIKGNLLSFKRFLAE